MPSYKVTIKETLEMEVEIEAEDSMDMAFMTAIVVGGAFFGDNLSFISDTTIAATRTHTNLEGTYM